MRSKLLILFVTLLLVGTLLIVVVTPTSAIIFFHDLRSVSCVTNSGVTFTGFVGATGTPLQYTLSDGTNTLNLTKTFTSIGLQTISVPASSLSPPLDLSEGSVITMTETNDDLQSLTATCSKDGAGALAQNLLDGRINNDQSQDVSAPVAVYLGSIEIYGIDPATGNGALDLSISTETIDAIAVPEVNTLLAEGVNSYTGQPISVWRLASGQFQLNTTYADGKAYIIAWETGGVNLTHYAA